MTSLATVSDQNPQSETATSLLTVLFVDDEPNVLQGLRRSTRRMRDRWDMHFAESGPAALDLLAQLERVDIVVSDMRMPEMDGAEFLTEVRKRYPHTARIILSGQSDREGILRAIGPAHQYLAKPCDTDELAAVVERIRAAGSHVLLDPVRTLAGQADRLPSAPSAFHKLSVLLGTPTWDLKAVAAIVSEDVALSAEILKLVNSAFFGLASTVDSVERAVSALGVDMVQAIILSNKVFDADDDLADWIDLEQLGYRSRAVAAGARGLALRDGASRSIAADAFLSGMVNEVGLLVMARLPGVSDAVASSLNVLVNDEIERAVFGGNRFRVGAHLLSLWGFKEEIVDSIGQLGDVNPAETEGLGWYLLASRALIFDLGFDSEALADQHTALPALDAALDAIRSGADLTGAPRGDVDD